MSQKKKLYVLSVQTESGDHYGPFLFERKPTDTKLEVFLRNYVSEDEFEDGPGWRGTYLHLTWTQQPVHAV